MEEARRRERKIKRLRKRGVMRIIDTIILQIIASSGAISPLLWGDDEMWTQYSQQQSSSLFLYESRYYYIETLMKQTTGPSMQVWMHDYIYIYKYACCMYVLMFICSYVFISVCMRVRFYIVFVFTFYLFFDLKFVMCE